MEERGWEGRPLSRETSINWEIFCDCVIGTDERMNPFKQIIQALINVCGACGQTCSI